MSSLGDPPEPGDVTNADVQPTQTATRPAASVAAKETGKCEDSVEKPVASSLPIGTNPATEVPPSTEGSPPHPTTDGGPPHPTEETVATEGSSPHPTEETVATEGSSPHPTGKTVATEGSSPHPTEKTMATEGGPPHPTGKTVATEGSPPHPIEKTVATEGGPLHPRKDILPHEVEQVATHKHLAPPGKGGTTPEKKVWLL